MDYTNNGSQNIKKIFGIIFFVLAALIILFYIFPYFPLELQLYMPVVVSLSMILLPLILTIITSIILSLNGYRYTKRKEQFYSKISKILISKEAGKADIDKLDIKIKELSMICDKYIGIKLIIGIILFLGSFYTAFFYLMSLGYGYHNSDDAALYIMIAIGSIVLLVLIYSVLFVMKVYSNYCLTENIVEKEASIYNLINKILMDNKIIENELKFDKFKEDNFILNFLVFISIIFSFGFVSNIYAYLRLNNYLLKSEKTDNELYKIFQNDLQVSDFSGYNNTPKIHY